MFKKIVVLVVVCLALIFILEFAQIMLADTYAVDSAMEQMEIDGATMDEYNNTMSFITGLETLIILITVGTVICIFRKVVI